MDRIAILRDGERVRQAITPYLPADGAGEKHFNAPLPFITRDGHSLCWAVYDIEQKLLKRINALPENQQIQKNGISVEAGFTPVKAQVEMGKPAEVTFYVRNTAMSRFIW